MKARKSMDKHRMNNLLRLFNPHFDEFEASPGFKKLEKKYQFLLDLPMKELENYLAEKEKTRIGPIEQAEAYEGWWVAEQEVEGHVAAVDEFEARSPVTSEEKSLWPMEARISLAKKHIWMLDKLLAVGSLSLQEFNLLDGEAMISLWGDKLSDQQKDYGEKSVQALSTLNNLGLAYAITGYYEEAISLLRDTAIDLEIVLGYESDQVTACRKNLLIIPQILRVPVPVPVEERKQEGRCFKLTYREANTLQEIAAGKSSQDLAETLGVTRTTVQRYLRRALREIGTKNIREAAARAGRQGFVYWNGTDVGRKDGTGSFALAQPVSYAATSPDSGSLN